MGTLLEQALTSPETRDRAVLQEIVAEQADGFAPWGEM